MEETWAEEVERVSAKQEAELKERLTKQVYKEIAAKNKLQRQASKKTSMAKKPVLKKAVVRTGFIEELLNSYVKLASRPLCLILSVALAVVLIAEVTESQNGPLELVRDNVKTLKDSKLRFERLIYTILYPISNHLVAGKNYIFSVGILVVCAFYKPNTTNYIACGVLGVTFILMSKVLGELSGFVLCNFYFQYISVPSNKYKLIIVLLAAVTFYFMFIIESSVENAAGGNTATNNVRRHRSIRAADTAPTTATRENGN